MGFPATPPPAPGDGGSARQTCRDNLMAIPEKISGDKLAGITGGIKTIGNECRTGITQYNRKPPRGHMVALCRISLVFRLASYMDLTPPERYSSLVVFGGYGTCHLSIFQQVLRGRSFDTSLTSVITTANVHRFPGVVHSVIPVPL